MSTHLKIFNQEEITAFEYPPEFNGDERKQIFALREWAVKLVESFRTPTNQIGFILQLGYFKAVNRFFAAKKFRPKDVEFIARHLQVSLESIDFGNYIGATFIRQQEIILENLGFRPFDEQAKLLLMKEALSISSTQIKPRFMFMSLVGFLAITQCLKLSQMP
jgi:hypothetical protein